MTGIVLWLLCFSLLLPGVSISGEAGNAGVITGVVMTEDGRPMSGGKIVFFRKDSGPPPSPRRYLRPPDEVAGIDNNGVFAAALPEGKYYLSAIRKRTGDLIGPPAEGDQVFPSPDDLRSGQKIYLVRKGERTDIGIATAVRFSRTALAGEGPVTAIEGVVTDRKGNPVPGAIALGFRSPGVTGKPLFVSESTGADGKYLLRVSEGGTYYIKIRTSLKGGHPVEGEIIGVYGMGKPQPVTVKTGEAVKGIDIRGREFTGFPKDPSRKGR